MKVFINNLNAISPQDTFSQASLSGTVRKYEDVLFLKCIEPKYSEFIDPMVSRRMSRMVKMGLTSALSCLRSSGVEQPGAIITATSLGCIEDTTRFLNSIYENEERLLNPTPFIQSTHNTVSASIAQAIKCNNYNTTYCDAGFAFENALLDAMMLIHEGSADNILAGAADELTPALFSITERLGLWKRKPVSNLELLSGSSSGSIAGEGAAFFLLGSEKTGNSYCSMDSVKMLYRPGSLSEVEAFLKRMIEENVMSENERADLVLMGYNGDAQQDDIYNCLRKNIFNSVPSAFYKHLCGEYQTSISFALYLAARILKEQRIPAVMQLNNFSQNEIKNILIYNHLRNKNHSAILVSRC